MMPLLDQTLGKPLKSQALEQRDYNITEEGLEFSQAVNGTPQIRGKRDLPVDCSDTLERLCSGQKKVYLPPENRCEKGRYMCFGFSEAVCKDTFSWASSPACNIKIGIAGRPSCSPVRENVIISTGECVRRTHHCSC